MEMTEKLTSLDKVVINVTSQQPIFYSNFYIPKILFFTGVTHAEKVGWELTDKHLLFLPEH